jgi:hypothetical protein
MHLSPNASGPGKNRGLSTAIRERCTTNQSNSSCVTDRARRSGDTELAPINAGTRVQGNVASGQNSIVCGTAKKLDAANGTAHGGA